MSFSNKVKRKLKQNLISLNRSEINVLFRTLVEKCNFQTVINELVYPVMKDIGILWENGELALSQVYMSGKIVQDVFKKYFPTNPNVKIKKTKIGLANLEDYHPLGMGIIESYLENFGIKPAVYPIGITVDDLYRRIIQDNIEILLISTLMLRSALKIKDLTKKIRQKKLGIKVIVGGAPFIFDETLWQDVGADGVGNNAFNVIELIQNIEGFSHEK